MSPRQALASALHLFVVLAFFIAGFFFVSLPYLPEIKTQIFEKSTLIGLSLFLTALILLLGFYALDRGRYLVIRMGVSTDANVIRQTVEDCFARQFSKKISLSEIEIGRRSSLEIKISLTPLDEDAREALFVEAEKQLTLLLKERFGYSKPFHLIVKL
jgi:hypothetical protein